MRELKTTITKEDLKGYVWDSTDCPGYRAFKRVYKSNMPWYNILKKIMLRYFLFWDQYSGVFIGSHWLSYDEEGDLKNMMESKLGDVVIFKKE